MKALNRYINTTTDAAPLAVFRIAFGLLLFLGVVRFWANGWIYDLYIKPKFFFTFYGFEFVRPLGDGTYVLFAICGMAALMVAAGLWYRWASIALFLSFTYIELIDKTTYLNHYYFISMMALMMIFLPAHRTFSLDVLRNPDMAVDRIPRWCIDAIKLFVCFLYFFAGLAKVNSDWLLHAQPLRIWLPAKNDIPFIGHLFNYTWVAFAFSWIGCTYDLTIPFLLWNRRTQRVAYLFVVIFHVLTSLLFPIGMFPYIMIVTALIFFPPQFHKRILVSVSRGMGFPQLHRTAIALHYREITSRLLIAGFTVFFLVQLAMPFRYWLYPGELFWTEEGFRFSWRVMLMEKAGIAEFTVKDMDGSAVLVNNSDFLTPLQEKQMSFQPDMILQFAQYLRDHFKANGFASPQVYVDSYVSLNGRLGKPLIDPTVDLAAQQESLAHKPWILTFGDDIKGL